MFGPRATYPGCSPTGLGQPSSVPGFGTRPEEEAVPTHFPYAGPFPASLPGGAGGLPCAKAAGIPSPKEAAVSPATTTSLRIVILLIARAPDGLGRQFDTSHQSPPLNVAAGIRTVSQASVIVPVDGGSRNRCPQEDVRAGTLS